MKEEVIQLRDNIQREFERIEGFNYTSDYDDGKRFICSYVIGKLNEILKETV